MKEENIVVCDVEGCGKTIHIGDWPFCPHGRPETKMQGFEPYIDYTIAEYPVFIEGRGHRNQIMRENNLEPMDHGRDGLGGARWV